MTDDQRSEMIGKMVIAITKQFMKEGKLIEMGFRIFLLHSYTPPGEIPTGMVMVGMPKEQYDMLRSAFFAGCQHLFASLVTGLDEDREPTEEDMKKMELINDELDQFIEEFKKQHNL